MLGIQHLSHLLPHCEQVSSQRIPYALVDGVDRRAPIFALDRGIEVTLGVVGGAGCGLRLGTCNAASQWCAVACSSRIFEVVEGGCNYD